MDEPIRAIKGENALRNFIRGLKPKSVVLFVINARKYHQLHPRLLRTVIEEKKFAGIYVTVNKPYEILVKNLKDNGINTENIFFIDAITKSVSEEIRISEDCLYIPSPSRLTDLSIALSQALGGMRRKESKFIFIDSLSTLLIYNSFDVISKFIHFLISRLRLFGLVGIIISIEKQVDERMLNLLTEMCDEIVEVR